MYKIGLYFWLFFIICKFNYCPECVLSYCFYYKKFEFFNVIFHRRNNKNITLLVNGDEDLQLLQKSNYTNYMLISNYRKKTIFINIILVSSIKIYVCTDKRPVEIRHLWIILIKKITKPYRIKKKPQFQLLALKMFPV